jgi:hypothetical protein
MCFLVKYTQVKNKKKQDNESKNAKQNSFPFTISEKGE